MPQKTFVLLLLLVAKLPPLAAQEPYAASLIPDSLKTHAHMVFREDAESFTVTSPSRATYKVHEVITVLDRDGERGLNFGVYTDAFDKLEDAAITVYDDAGKQIQHVKQKDMSTAEFGSNLVDDGRYIHYSVQTTTFPITVEKDYTLNYKGLVDYPSFGLDNTEQAIQQASYVLTAPSSVGIRYKNRGTGVAPQVEDGPGDTRVYTWKVSEIRGHRLESGVFPGNGAAVLIAPTLFDLDNHPGDMSSWGSFGKWVYDLNKETFVLPEASKEFYRRLVAGAASDRDKERILYTWLQKNFRYVSIQLGIGGLRSFPAGFTETNKYGDCKGLSTYMKACLEAVGIKSYTAIINAGYMQAPVDSSFPANEFNHMIVCIPGRDTTWLECTSNRTDFGVLGAFTEDRYALLITENGGVLTRTPASGAEENTSSAYTQVDLAEDGSGKAEVTLSATGAFKMDRIAHLYEEKHEDQKRYLVSALRFMPPDDFTVSLGSVDTPLFRADIQLSLEKIPDFLAGAKMFLFPRLYPILYRPMTAGDRRNFDFYFSYPYIITDTTCYRLPDGYTVDHLPQGKVLRTPYVTYTSAYWYDPSRKAVFSSGLLRLTSRKIPAGDFPAVKQLFNQVEEEGAEKIVIDKK